MDINKFWCEVYQHDEVTKVGVITDIIAGSVQRNNVINGIGTMQFTIPQKVFSDLSIVQGMMLWFPQLGWKYYVETWDYSSGNNTPTLKCQDELVKLKWATIGFSRKFSGDILVLLARMMNWGLSKYVDGASIDGLNSLGQPGYFLSEYNFSFDSNIQGQEAVVIFEGETFLAAMLTLCKFYGAYFCLVKHSGVFKSGVANDPGIYKFGFFRSSPFRPNLYGVDSAYGDMVYLYNNLFLYDYSISSHNLSLVEYPVNYPDALRDLDYSLQLTGVNDPYGFGLTLATNQEFILPEITDTPKQFLQIAEVTQTSVGTQLVNKLYMQGGGIFPYKDNAGNWLQINTAGVVVTSNGKLLESPLNLYYSNAEGKYPIAYDSQAKMWYMSAPDSTVWPQPRESVVSYKEIVPLGTSAADLQYAANTLYAIGTYLLDKFKSPVETYTLKTLGDISTLKVSSILRLNYQGRVSTSSGYSTTKTIDDFFYVLGISETYDTNGEEHFEVKISRNGQEEMEFHDVVTDIYNEVKKLNIRLTPSITYNNWASPTLDVYGGNDVGDIRPALFKFYIDDGVYSINEMVAEIHVQRKQQITTRLTENPALNNALDLGINGLTGKAIFSPDWKYPHRHTIDILELNSAAGANDPLYIARSPGVYAGTPYNFLYSVYALGSSRVWNLMTSGLIVRDVDSASKPLPVPALDLAIDPLTIQVLPAVTMHTHTASVIISNTSNDLAANARTTAKFNGNALTLVQDLSASTINNIVYRVRLTELINGIDFRNKWHTIEVGVGGGADLTTFINVKARMTVIPIQV